MSTGETFLLVYGINFAVNLLLEFLYCWIDYKSQMENYGKFNMTVSRVMQGFFLLIFGFIGTIFIFIGLFDDFDDVDIISIKQKTEEDKQKPYRKKWVSVKRRMPKLDSIVLVYAKLPELHGQLIDVMAYTNSGFEGTIPEQDVKDINKKITHWMELPDPPKE